MRKWASISGIGLLFVLCACRQGEPKTGMISAKVEFHVDEHPAAVSFGIEPDGKQSPERWKYKASYARNGKTARFGFELIMASLKSGEASPRSGHGSFIGFAKSFDADLLKDLQTMLKASTAPQSDIRVRQLPFNFLIEGENLDRGNNGLIDTTTGNWVKAKIFLGPQQDKEVFLNFQKPGGTGEFVMADPAFGNAVLQELAKVL